MTIVIPKYLCVLELRLRRSKYWAMAMLSHRQGWAVAALLLMLPSSFVAATASDLPTTYRTGTSEVRVTFFATDRDNRLVESITRDDFAVVDNGLVIRDFRSLTRSDETSLDVSLLIDTSESVARRFGQTREGVLHLLTHNELKPSDRLSIITFAGLHPQLVCADDCGNSSVEHRLVSIKATGATPLFDSLTYAARLIHRRRDAGMRPVLVLFSDGNDTISMASLGEALDAVVGSGAVLYTVNSDSAPASTSGTALQRMAEATGGRSFTLQQGVAQTLDAVLADLHHSYVVSYQLPTHLVGFHSLRILPKHDLNLQFHCRRGYYYDEIH
jgi:VWFA-related protein